MFGTWAPGHHAAQVLLFAAAAALVPAALGAFGVRRGVAFSGRTALAAHPFRVESVAWAANLKDVTSLLAVLATFALLARGRTGLAALGFAGAVLAKTMVFPLALLVPFALPGRTWRQRLALTLPFAAVALAAAGVGARLHYFGPPPEDQAFLGGSLLAALPSALYLPWWYLRQALAPSPLAATWAFEAVEPSDARFALAIGCYAALAVGLWVAQRRGALLPAAALAAGWFLPLAPVVGLAPLAFPVALRYTLLPSLALCCAVALLAARLASGTREAAARGPSTSLGTGLAVGAGLFLVAAGAASVVRQREWRSAITLWEADRARQPESWAARVNLAGAYGGEGRWQEAIVELDQARRLNPPRLRTSADLFFALGAARGMGPATLTARHDELLATRGHPEAWHRLAALTLKEGYPDAAAVLLEGLLARGASAKAHALLAKAELARRRFPSAAEHARAALALAPGDTAPTADLVLALVEDGKAEEALAAASVDLPDARTQATVKGLAGLCPVPLGALGGGRLAAGGGTQGAGGHGGEPALAPESAGAHLAPQWLLRRGSKRKEGRTLQSAGGTAPWRALGPAGKMDALCPRRRRPSTPSTDLLGKAKQQSAYLIVISAKSAAGIGRMHKLERAEVVLGRSSEAQFQVEDDGISRKHAKVVARAGRQLPAGGPRLAPTAPTSTALKVNAAPLLATATRSRSAPTPSSSSPSRTSWRSSTSAASTSPPRATASPRSTTRSTSWRRCARSSRTACATACRCRW